jgi:RimJ/RimL family protein N-acetyltransferase
VEIKPVILKGKAIRLEPLKIDHLQGLFEAGQDAAIWSYMPSTVRSIESMADWIEKALSNQEKGLDLPFVVIDQNTGEILGSTRFLDIAPKDRGLEIGFTWYTPRVWRTSVNTEAKYLLLKHCFETLKTIRVQFKTHHLNLASQKAIERIGGVKEGILRNHRIQEDGSIRHSVYYSILDTEWETIKERFEKTLLKRSVGK